MYRKKLHWKKNYSLFKRRHKQTRFQYLTRLTFTQQWSNMSASLSFRSLACLLAYGTHLMRDLARYDLSFSLREKFTGALFPLFASLSRGPKSVVWCSLVQDERLKNYTFGVFLTSEKQRCAFTVCFVDSVSSIMFGNLTSSRSTVKCISQTAKAISGSSYHK